MTKDDQDSTGKPSEREMGRLGSEMGGIALERGGAQIEPRIQTEIGKHLRAIYDDVINEPVPSKFMELLEKLERSTAPKG